MEMFKGRSLFLAMIALCSIGFIYFLQIFSQHVNNRPNGFIRSFPPKLISLRKVFNLKYNSYYVAGLSTNHIYLGNYNARANILITDYDFSDTMNIKIKLPDNGSWLTNSFKVKVDSPNIYIMDGQRPAILRASLLSPLASRYTYDSSYFIDCLPISAQSFAIRSYKNSIHQNVLLKQSSDSPHVKIAHQILKKQVDGFFCTDGTMSFDRSTGRLTYVYYYRNQFLCLDTNLNPIYEARTIDTISQAQIKVAALDAGTSSILAAPALTVNQRSAASEGVLFVYSLLRANNETEERFNSYSAIDLYSLDDGHYMYSLYLNDIQQKKLSYFSVWRHKLVAIHDHYLAVYDLRF